jgi:FkbM family methyltransferase
MLIPGRDLVGRAIRGGGRRSYAQAGEDLIIENALAELGIARPTYLDGGAHHPTWLSNTYALYRRGFRGVLVEPDPEACRLLRRGRRGDLVIEAALAPQAGRGRLHLARDRSHASLRPAAGDAVDAVLDVELITLEQAAASVPSPTVISLDLEGLDLEVLAATELGRLGATVICVETGPDPAPFDELLTGNGYRVYARTPANTIYVAGPGPLP